VIMFWRMPSVNSGRVIIPSVTTGTPIEAGGLLCEYKNTAESLLNHSRNLDSIRQAVVIESGEFMYDGHIIQGLL